MSIRSAKLAERLRTSLWVIPAGCTLAAALLAFGLIEFDRQTANTDFSLPGTFQGGAESARAVLSTIAGSMVTVAGTVYSITIVALTLASQQFAPRVLGSFMRDRTNQVVLGFFVATFTYCLLVLRAVRGTAETEFVPGAAVTGGVGLALISLVMLIYFIDHISHGIQVSSIIRGVARETRQQIDAVYPDRWRATEAIPDKTPVLPADWAPILARRSGYLQYTDYQALVHAAARADVVLREDRGTGAFVTGGTPLVFAGPAAWITPALEAQVNDAFALGSTPTMQQDVAFGLRQIVDIALKAISPAVNDPTTALNCIDHLGAILVVLAARKYPDPGRYDARGRLRVIAHERTFHDLARLAFDQIRHYGAGDHIIVLRMIDVIAQVAAATPSPQHRAALGEQLAHIVAAAQARLTDAVELQAVNEHAQVARHALDAPAQGLAAQEYTHA
jgi:uncharacterized membrane protein